MSDEIDWGEQMDEVKHLIGLRVAALRLVLASWRADEICDATMDREDWGAQVDDAVAVQDSIIKDMPAEDLRMVVWELVELLAKAWPVANKDQENPLEFVRTNVEKSVATMLDKIS